VQCYRFFFQPQLGEIFNDEHGADNVWFQQGGATAHTSRRSLSLLREMFLDMLSPCVVISGGRRVRQI